LKKGDKPATGVKRRYYIMTNFKESIATIDELSKSATAFFRRHRRGEGN